MVAPDRSAQRNALLRKRARHTGFTRARGAAASVEPAVRTESQAVGKGVVHIGRASEAVEHNFRRAVRHIVTIAVGNETQLRRAHRPHAPVPDLDAGQHLQLVSEHLARVEPAVAVLVFKNQDAIAQIEIELPAGLRVSVVLRDPQPPARVPRHRDGILHVRFGGEDSGFEAGRQSHLRRRLGSGHRPRLIRLRIVWNGELGRAQTEWNKQQQQHFLHGPAGTLLFIFPENHRLSFIASAGGWCE